MARTSQCVYNFDAGEDLADRLDWLKARGHGVLSEWIRTALQEAWERQSLEEPYRARVIEDGKGDEKKI